MRDPPPAVVGGSLAAGTDAGQDVIRVDPGHSPGRRGPVDSYATHTLRNLAHMPACAAPAPVIVGINPDVAWRGGPGSRTGCGSSRRHLPLSAGDRAPRYTRCGTAGLVAVPDRSAGGRPSRLVAEPVGPGCSSIPGTTGEPLPGEVPEPRDGNHFGVGHPLLRHVSTRHPSRRIRGPSAVHAATFTPAHPGTDQPNPCDPPDG